MPPELEQREVDAIMKAVNDARQSALPDIAREAEVAPWDLTNPERNVPDPMPVLEGAHEMLGARFARRLVGRTRRHINGKNLGTRKTRGDELLDLLMPPHVVIRLQLDPTPYDAVVVLDLQTAEALLEAGLGGAADIASEDVDGHFTRVEERVLLQLVSLLCDPLGKAYSDIVPIRPRVTGIEHDPRLALPMGHQDLALVTTFELSGSVEGRFNLALPFSLFESSRQRLSKRTESRKARDPRFAEGLRQQVSQVELEVRALLGSGEVSLAEARALAPDSLLVLDTAEHEPLPAQIGGRERLRFRPRVEQGRLAIEIVEIVKANSQGGPVMSDVDAQSALGAIPGAEDAFSTPSRSSLQLGDVPIHVSVELGRTQLPVEKLMSLTAGSVLTLDKAAGAPLDVVLNGRLVARGEAVVVGERFGVRITELVSAQPERD